MLLLPPWQMSKLGISGPGIAYYKVFLSTMRTCSFTMQASLRRGGKVLVVCHCQDARLTAAFALAWLMVTGRRTPLGWFAHMEAEENFPVPRLSDVHEVSLSQLDDENHAICNSFAVFRESKYCSAGASQLPDCSSSCSCCIGDSGSRAESGCASCRSSWRRKRRSCAGCTSHPGGPSGPQAALHRLVPEWAERLKNG